MFAAGIQAQILNPTGNTIKGLIYEYYIPCSYSADGKAYMVLDETPNEAAYTQLGIYDDKISKVKTINIPMPENSRSYYVVREREEVVKTQYSYREERGYVLSLDVAKDSLAKWRFNVDSTSVVNDSVYLFSSNEDYYYRSYEFGRLYPKTYYAYKDNSLFRIECGYGSAYTGEWKETITYNYENYDQRTVPMPIRPENYNDGIFSSGEMLVSQTLFNSDDSYEYVEPICYIVNEYTNESDRDYDGEIDHIGSRYISHIKGFNIMSENGNILQTVEMPANIKAEYLYLFRINDNTYLCCNGYDEENNSECYIFYSITPGSTGIQQIGEPIKARVHPTVAGRNETITVELDGNGNGEKEIFVNNAAGQTVYKSNIPAGQKSVQINASSLSSGLNVVSVKSNNRKVESNKVIIK